MEHSIKMSLANMGKASTSAINGKASIDKKDYTARKDAALSSI